MPQNETLHSLNKISQFPFKRTTKSFSFQLCAIWSPFTSRLHKTLQ